MPKNTSNPPLEKTGNPPLFLALPDTDFREYLDEIARFADSNPDIVAAVEADLDRHALEKKEARRADREFMERQTPLLSGFNEVKGDRVPVTELQAGRPRTPALLVFVMSMLRGFLGSLTDRPAQRFLYESVSLLCFLEDRGFKLPAPTTLIENVNQISASTQELIFKRQIEQVLEEDLDDFRQLMIDSTAVHADSAWPTDGRMLVGLVERAFRIGRKLGRFGLCDFVEGHVPRWIREMRSIEFEINLVSGKKGADRKRKRLYNKLLKKGKKAVAALKKEFGKKADGASCDGMLPSHARQVEEVVGLIRNDLGDAQRVLDYTDGRIFQGKTLPAREKILSLADGSAAYISKGGRDPVIGYKPQLVRSANGFIADLTVPEGNAADSAQFVPCIQEAMNRTGRIAELVSSDDGYSSQKGMNTLRELGVGIVSISGAKGKKITDPEEWDSTPYQEARNNRSAVESLMFTLKDGYAFGRLSRRGIDAVRSELLEKVLAYNFCRILEIRKRQAEELRLAG